ncbi:hypothetical protein CAPTEDRAFT_113391 [Capitella teleta]|uniref:Protein Churchill n=1 Tax=Capitella teleta TaxID=283909 RepID=R7TXR5_CAPTE|nr:hypothetical protein CAPTEDRAFT_113391 [Capitella teleta]|eukprot:ELT95755.1 hypothetical protein CAPTEDRAFT_113391 [Capitella teleta]
MCNGCVKEEFPDRDSMCLEEGAYFLNFKFCSQCHKKDDVLVISNRIREEIGDVESINYQHVCQNCDHIIAEHEYKFEVEAGFQHYEMNCMLCGFGDDSRSVLPRDPRQQPMFF